MPSLQKQYLSMMAMAVVLVTAGIFFSAKAFREMERPVGPSVSDAEIEKIGNVYSLINAAEEMSESDAESAKKTLEQAFDEIDNLDGYRLESGNVFRRDSSALLAAYEAKAKMADMESDCGEAKKIAADMKKLMAGKYVVIPFRPVGPFTVMFGSEEYYEKSRKKNNESVAMRMKRELKNCGGF